MTYINKTRPKTTHQLFFTIMGRLVGLELHNFKSYKGTAKIGFGDAAFTSIIGPNGAGKSNMMDAISFVLGVQSLHLRSLNLKDLIYRGRLGSETPENRAYVCAVYEKEGGELLHLKRIITSSGTSDYKINEKSVTAFQYSVTLKAENILIKARNFLVFQGDIEHVASQSAKDLANLVETISGSAECAQEYLQLKDEHEKAHELATEVFSRKRNLNSESKQYKEQMREREIFESKLHEKNTLVKVVNLYRIFHNEKRHFQLLGDVRRISEHISSTTTKLAAQQEAYQKLVVEYTKDGLEIKKLASNISEFQSKTEASKRALIPVHSNKKNLLNKISLSEKKIRDLQTDLENQQAQQTVLRKKLMDAEKLYNEFEHRIETLNKKTKISLEGIKEYEQLRSKFLANSGSQYEETLAMSNNDRDAFVSSLTNHNKQKDNAISRIAELESEVQLHFGLKLADFNSKLNDLLSTKASKQKSRESLLKKKEEVNFAELEFNSELRNTLLRLDELSSQQRESRKQKKLRENVSMLKNLLKDGSIKGLVYELVRSSQQKFETALLTVLGKNFDAIVVESTAVAHKCIEILKERRSGTATFIPLDSVVTDQVNLNYLRSLHEKARPAMDVVKFDDPSVERAIQFVVGDTMVVDTIEVARDLKWGQHSGLKSKLVAVDGSVIHKSGLMTGGQQEQKNDATLRWNKEEWNRLNEKKDDLTEKLAKAGAEKPSAIDINNLTEEISQIDDELPLARNQIASIERQIYERTQEIKFHQELIETIDQNISDKQKDLDILELEIEETQVNIKKLQDKVYSEFCKKYKLKNGISDYESLHGSALRARAREKAEFQKAISSYQNQLSFQTDRIQETEERTEKLQGDLSSYKKELIEINEELESKSSSLDTLEAELEVLIADKEKNEEALSQKMKDAKLKDVEAKDLELELKNFNNEMAHSEEVIMKVDSERINMLKNCKIENVDLPLEDGFLESISLGDEVEDVAKIAYQVHIDYALLEVKYQDGFSNKVEAEIRARIEQVEKDLQLLTPNAKAVERLREVDQKLKEFDREFTKSRQKEKKTSEKFNDVKGRRTELFMKAFTHISDKIDSIYKELTRSNASPLGGSAYLTLEDEDEPYAAGIKYHAMPPMKRFRDMELLSGGEKTMAALALLFAIHSFHPSPFFVLDEVDAALDNSNVAKIANYIKNHAGPGFQFIVISLKSTLFENSDALVGIYREQRENSSKTVTVDLRNYPEGLEEIAVSVPQTTTA